MTCAEFDRAMALMLAVIALIVATGLWCGVSMWGWILVYWIVLTAKNAVAAIHSNARQRISNARER